MLLSNPDIIKNRRLIELESGEAAEALELRGGLTLILKPDAIALYRSLDSFFDPLGTGCMGCRFTDRTTACLVKQSNHAGT